MTASHDQAAAPRTVPRSEPSPVRAVATALRRVRDPGRKTKEIVMIRLSLAVAALTLAVGCASNEATRGAVTGGAIGAAAGAAIGNNVGDGDAGQGALIGGALGAAVGANAGANSARTAPPPVNRQQYYDQRSGRYYFYDPATNRYFYENGAPYP